MKVHQTLEWLNLSSLGTKGLKPHQQSVYNQGSVTGGGWRGHHLNNIHQQHWSAILSISNQHTLSLPAACHSNTALVWWEKWRPAGRAGTCLCVWCVSLLKRPLPSSMTRETPLPPPPSQPSWAEVTTWAISANEMRSSQAVRASGCQCQSHNSPGFDASILRHSGIWGAADEAVLKNVHKKIQSLPHCHSLFSLDANESLCTVIRRHKI